MNAKDVIGSTGDTDDSAAQPVDPRTMREHGGDLYEDLALRLADGLAVRERRRAAEREFRDDLRRRRARWLDHRHRRKLAKGTEDRSRALGVGLPEGETPR